MGVGDDAVCVMAYLGEGVGEGGGGGAEDYAGCSQLSYRGGDGDVEGDEGTEGGGFCGRAAEEGKHDAQTLCQRRVKVAFVLWTRFI